ncbi:uncharacterized protein SOCE26_028900 [Sorangium cellulosum]|uniref:PEGA domain-containing protein n=1 Tax=Sorangium cellulosum TaxID=56 RepID=A0A2L0EQ92_SORCE|nr:uncharacterized protein SOCE26_028900 [Sorangium cellulosum]
MLLAYPAVAGPGDKEANQGINAAKGGFCKRAIPLLESAEEQRHRPSSAVPLADCYAKQGELRKAAEIYHTVANEKKEPGYSARDVVAITSAKKKAAALDARIPTLVVAPAEPYEGLEVEVNGEVISDPSTPHRFDPGVPLVVVARAEGYEESSQKVVLKEKQRRELKLRLKPKPGAKPPAEKKPVETKPVEKKPVEKKPPAEKKPVETKPPVQKKPVEKKPVEKKPVEKKPPAEKKPVEKKPPSGPDKAAEAKPRPDDKPLVEPTKPEPLAPVQHNVWLGAGFQGFLIPKLAFSLFGEGGRNVLVPGGDVALTAKIGRLDLVFSIAYARFLMKDTPFKPNGHPDTDYEIIASDLQAVQASASFLWNIPLDRGELFSFRIGAGIGAGWTFLGELYRTQAYPGDAVPGDPSTFVPGDPYRYVKCRGPNNPAGSFRYCNQLDYDADHYNGYVEPSWFTRPRGRPQGLKPVVYPWLVLPEVGLTFKPWKRVAFDLRAGASVTGLLGGLDLRFAL